MKFENIENARKLLTDAKTIRTMKQNLAEKRRKDSSIDKAGIGFFLDSRFSMFQVQVSFDSWTGYYGNSGCSTFAHVQDEKEVAIAFKEYVKAHENQILEWMAKHLVNKALLLNENVHKEIESAKKEIEELQAELQEATK